MQNTEASCGESERVIKKFKPNSSLPSLVFENKNQPETSQPKFCLFSKLLKLHNEESSKNSEENRTGLRYNSFLLEKLVMKERLNTLIFKLYPGNKGYSMAFRSIPRTEPSCEDTANIIETVRWSYDNDDILRHIDNEELPPFLVDVFETHYSHLFYSGCIIAEIRDYRRAYPHIKCDIHHVLLRPTLKTVIADVNNIMATGTSTTLDRDEWSTEERHMLESQMLLANNPHVCLDPDNAISTSQLRLNHNRNMWNTHKFHWMARKYSQVTCTKKRKLELYTARAGLELHGYVDRLKTKSRNAGSTSIAATPKTESRLNPVRNLENSIVVAPSKGIAINEFKAYKPPRNSDDYQPELVESYILETTITSKENKKRVYHIKLSILQRPSNSEYLGELYLDRDYKEKEQNGVSCRFTLGSNLHVNKYVRQFTETFTRSGRQKVRMKCDRNAKYMGSFDSLQPLIVTQSTGLQQQKILSQPHTQNQQLGAFTNHIVNGYIPGRNILQTGTSSNAQFLQGYLQSSSMSLKKISAPTNEELKIKEIAKALMNSTDQFQAAKHEPDRQQPSQIIRGLLNSSPASDASAVIVNAISNTSQQVMEARQVTLVNARVLKNRNESLSALLDGTPACNRIDVAASNFNSALFKDLEASSCASTASQSFLQGGGRKPQQYVPLQAASKINNATTQSPLSSPSSSSATTPSPSPSPGPKTTISLQSLVGLQNLQFQLPEGFSLAPAGSSQGHPTTGLLVASSGAATPIAQAANNGTGAVNAGQTVFFANPGHLTIAQFISGMKAQGVPATASLAPGQLQVMSIQAPRIQQANCNPQNLPSRNIQRTPVRMKMATTSQNANSSEVIFNNSRSQQQVQLHQYHQQLCQQQNVGTRGFSEKKK